MGLKQRFEDMKLGDKLGGIKRPSMPSPSGLKRVGLTGWLVVAALFTLFIDLVTGEGGCIEVHPGEVAVIYNNTGIPIFGDREKTVVEQGVKSFIPGVQTVEVLERKPQILVMAGDPEKAAEKAAEGEEHNHVKALTVRANDGSNFYFDGLEVHYQLVAGDASKVIATSGPREGYKVSLVKTHVREILRDEFGVYSFLDIADPTSYGAATAEAKKRLNERLAVYGVEVTQIITPKPKFDPRVEKAIEDRQSAEQDVSVQEEKRHKLEQEKQLKLQAIEQEKNQEYQSLVASLEAQKKGAENKLVAVQREADKYFIEEEAAGVGYRDEKLTRAKANETAYRKEAEGLAARINAIGAQGPDVLNGVIAEKVMPQLKRVRATPRMTPSSAIDVRHIEMTEQPPAPAATTGGAP